MAPFSPTQPSAVNPEDRQCSQAVWSMLDRIEGSLAAIDRTLRGDGSKDNPGIVITLDRLVQESERRSKMAEAHRSWLYSLTAGLVLALLAPWLSKLIAQ